MQTNKVHAIKVCRSHNDIRPLCSIVGEQKFGWSDVIILIMELFHKESRFGEYQLQASLDEKNKEYLFLRDVQRLIISETEKKLIFMDDPEIMIVLHYKFNAG